MRYNRDPRFFTEPRVLHSAPLRAAVRQAMLRPTRSGGCATARPSRAGKSRPLPDLSGRSAADGSVAMELCRYVARFTRCRFTSRDGTNVTATLFIDDIRITKPEPVEKEPEEVVGEY